jgi:hypothetical protein
MPWHNLFRAAQMNCELCSKVLLYRGADPFAMVPQIEWTPLHTAAQRDSSNIIQAYTGNSVKLVFGLFSRFDTVFIISVSMYLKA